MTGPVRPARADDVALLPVIERTAGAAFRTLGMDAVADDEPLPLETLERYQRSGRAWVAADDADQALGYLLLDLLDGAAHVEQVTVHPDARGQRIGAALLEAALEWSARHASGALTLTTFADVPWNAPYYRRLGFAEVEPRAWTPGLRAVVDHETELGLSRWPRVVMRRAGATGASPLTEVRAALRLRTATTEDVDEVLALWSCAAENDDRPADDAEHVRRLIARDPEALVIAVDGDAIVGSVIAGWDGWRCHLYRLAVAPSRRRTAGAASHQRCWPAPRVASSTWAVPALTRWCWRTTVAGTGCGRSPATHRRSGGDDGSRLSPSARRMPDDHSASEHRGWSQPD